MMFRILATVIGSAVLCGAGQTMSQMVPPNLPSRASNWIVFLFSPTTMVRVAEFLEDKSAECARADVRDERRVWRDHRQVRMREQPHRPAFLDQTSVQHEDDPVARAQP